MNEQGIERTGIQAERGEEDLLALREWLDEKLADHENELMLANPQIMSEIREARAEYEAGKYVTLEKLRRELTRAGDNDV